MKIVAFEPSPAARRVLERHVEINNLAGRVMTVDCGGGQDGDRLLYSVAENGMARLESPSAQLAASHATARTVPVTSLDGFVTRTGLEPRWIVMDIEGFEVQALLVAKSLIHRLRGRLGWVIEMHPLAWPAIGTSREVLESLLSVLGLTPLPLTGRRIPLRNTGTSSMSRRLSTRRG